MYHIPAEYPRPSVIALAMLGVTICIAIIFALLQHFLEMKSMSGGTASTFISAMVVGQYLASKRRSVMLRRTRWLAAVWYTALTLAIAATLLAFAVALGQQPLALGNMGMILVIAVVAVVISVPLTYGGLLLGEKMALKQAKKLAPKQK